MIYNQNLHGYGGKGILNGYEYEYGYDMQSWY